MIRSTGWLVAVMIGISVGSAFAADTGDQTSGELELMSSLTPKQRTDYADSAVKEMTGDLQTVQGLMDKAKRGGDAAQQQCLNGQFTPLQALVQIAQTAQQNMADAMASQDNAVADREFRKIVVGLDNVRHLEADAERCMSPTSSAGSQTKVTVSGDDYPDSNPDTKFEDDVLALAPPPTSPFI